MAYYYLYVLDNISETVLRVKSRDIRHYTRVNVLIQSKILLRQAMKRQYHARCGMKPGVLEFS